MLSLGVQGGCVSTASCQICGSTSQTPYQCATCKSGVCSGCMSCVPSTCQGAVVCNYLVDNSNKLGGCEACISTTDSPAAATATNSPAEATTDISCPDGGLDVLNGRVEGIASDGTDSISIAFNMITCLLQDASSTALDFYMNTSTLDILYDDESLNPATCLQNYHVPQIFLMGSAVTVPKFSISQGQSKNPFSFGINAAFFQDAENVYDCLSDRRRLDTEFGTFTVNTMIINNISMAWYNTLKAGTPSPSVQNCGSGSYQDECETGLVCCENLGCTTAEICNDVSPLFNFPLWAIIVIVVVVPILPCVIGLFVYLFAVLCCAASCGAIIQSYRGAEILCIPVVWCCRRCRNDKTQVPKDEQDHGPLPTSTTTPHFISQSQNTPTKESFTPSKDPDTRPSPPFNINTRNNEISMV